MTISIFAVLEDINNFYYKGEKFNDITYININNGMLMKKSEEGYTFHKIICDTNNKYELMDYFLFSCPVSCENLLYFYSVYVKDESLFLVTKGDFEVEDGYEYVIN